MVGMQVAIILDELPKEVLKKIEEGQENLEIIQEALVAVDLSGYFSKVEDPEEQRNFTAQCIQTFFENRRKRRKK